MKWIISGRIESTRSDHAALAECRVEVFFEQKAPTADSVELSVLRNSERWSDFTFYAPAESLDGATIQGHVSTSTSESGEFEVSLPDRTELASNKLRFVVSAPSGETIADVSRNADDIEDSVRIPVREVEPILLEPPLDPPKSKTRRVTGRVIDRQGKPLPSILQVLLFARKRGDEKGIQTVDKDLPVLVARADGSGYFFGDTPNVHYESAAALVTGVADEIVVALEDGFIPSRFVLLIDLPETGAAQPKKDDCDCEGSNVTPRTPSHSDMENAPDTYSVDLGMGRCVQFNAPNRAIEEFDFYMVVRTTEPAIRGFTLGGANRGATVRTDTPDAHTDIPEAETAAAAAAAAETAAIEAEARAAAAVRAKVAAEAVAAAATAAEVAAEAEGVAATMAETAANDRVQAAKEAVTAAKKWVPGKSAEDQEAEEAAAAEEAVQAEAAQVTAYDRWIKAMAARFPATQAKHAAKGVAVAAAAAAAVAKAAAEAARAAATTAAARAATTAATRVARAEAIAAAAKAKTAARAAADMPPGRDYLDGRNSVDWDSTPTFYEAATIAHGHLLHFKQVWYADGYSLGDLLYSLPLAPGQKKLISVVDWERRERTERTEAMFGSEELNAALSRDRDLGEVVTGALTESSRGGSQNTTVGVGAGTGAAGNGSYQGFNFGALLGVSGGYGQSDSFAWQESARNLSSNSLQNLRDRTLQSASAIRSVRSSVVHTVTQGEAVRATTEVVANHNHCHALTIQYFEVLRHLRLVHELTDVQECLFVPLPMYEFNRGMALRWRQSLQTYLQRRELSGGFDAARRVETGWSEVDVPLDRYADEKITSLSGELQLTVIIPLPPFPERPKPRPEDTLAETATAIVEATNPTTGFFGVLGAILTGGASLVVGAAATGAINATKGAIQGARALTDDFYAQPTVQERYNKFQREVMPGVAEGFVDQLELWALVGGIEVKIHEADFTLVSDYQPGVPLLVSLRGTLSGQFRRGDVSQLIIKSANGLPTGCRAIVHTAVIRYRTSTFEHAFVDDRRVNDDIDLPKVGVTFTNLLEIIVHKVAPGKGAALFTPIDAWEQRRPRTEDRRLSAELIEHLNDNLEFYHHAIWWTMDPNRRYMLLDGYLAPGSNGRSVASVVENRLIGIVGNSFVLPVARGNHLDPRFRPDAKNQSADLLDFYALESPVPPARVSLPTRGVFAEAVMGSCNACEQIDDSRFWRWEDSPIDEPPLIESASTVTRRGEPAGVQPTPFPTPIVSIQNAPSVPDPAGVRAALDALGRQSFPDITGLAGTQANAAAAYQQALDTAFKFGKEASTLAQQAAMLNAKDKTLGAIDSAEAGGKIDVNDAKQLRISALKKMVGDTPTDDKASSVADRIKVIDDQEAKGSITKEKAAELREQVMKGLDPENAPLNDEKKATTEVISKIPAGSIQLVETKEPSGATTTIKAQPSSADAGLMEDKLVANDINLGKYCTPAVRSFSPGNPLQGKSADKSGKTTLRAVVTNAPAGSTWHWSIASPTAAKIVSPTSYITDVVAGDPGLTDITFEVRDSGGTSLGKKTVKLSVPQFVVINEEAATFNAQLVAYYLDDVKAALLQRVKQVVDFLLANANVRTVWQLAPFNEAMPGHLVAGGFAAGKFSPLTIRGLSPNGLGEAGTTEPGGPAKPDDKIYIYPAAYRTPGTDVGVDVTTIVTKMAALNMTDPEIKSIWIEIMSRLLGETIAHEIHHALLGGWPGFMSGHNPPAPFGSPPLIPFDLMNRGTERSWLQRTGIEILNLANFPQPGSYRDGGMYAISGMQPANQVKVDSVFPVPPAFL